MCHSGRVRSGHVLRRSARALAISVAAPPAVAMMPVVGAALANRYGPVSAAEHGADAGAEVNSLNESADGLVASILQVSWRPLISR